MCEKVKVQTLEGKIVLMLNYFEEDHFSIKWNHLYALHRAYLNTGNNSNNIISFFHMIEYRKILDLKA